MTDKFPQNHSHTVNLHLALRNLIKGKKSYKFKSQEFSKVRYGHDEA